MKFDEIKKLYKRIDIISEANLINFYANRLARTKSFDEKNSIIREVDIIKRRYDSFYEYVFIRFAQDSSDKFFNGEFKYIEENEDEFKKACVKFAQTLLDDDDLDKLKKRWGKYFFDKLEIKQNLYYKDVIGLNINENKILKEISDRRNAISIPIDNEIVTSRNLITHLTSPDREKRKKLPLLWIKIMSKAKTFMRKSIETLLLLDTR